MSSLQAWDPIAQEARWEVDLDGVANAGTLTTAGGLVFQGRESGALVAHDAATGGELWRYDLGLGISAPPITYAIDGRQYIALLVGWGGGAAGLGGQRAADLGWSYGTQTRRLVAFSLEGGTTLPSLAAPVTVTPLEVPEFDVNPSLLELGGFEFETTCVLCHGRNVVSSGMAPDLRASGVVLSADAFERVVRQGELVERGMPPYAHLTDDQLEAMRHYIRWVAEQPAQ